MLHNVLSRQLPVDAGRVEAALATVGIDPRSPAADPRGGGVAGPARGARPDRPDGRGRRAPSRPPPTRTTPPPTPPTTPSTPTRRDRSAAPAHPGRPAGAGQAQPDARRRRPAGRRLPRAPLGVRAARPGRPAEPGDRRRAQRHAPRRGSRCRPAGGQPRAPCARRGPGGGRWRLAGRAGSGTGHRRPAREADPRRGRAGRRLAPTRPPRSTGRSRRGERSSTSRPDTRWPPISARTCRSSSPAGPRSSRAAASTSRRSTACTGRRASSSSRRSSRSPRPDVFAAFDAIRHAGDGRGPDVVRPPGRGAARRPDRGQPRRPRGRARRRPTTCCPATALVVPALVPFKRALSRLLARPIGLSGSGPTLWALYPSGTEATVAAETVRSALADGSLVAPGAAGAVRLRHDHRRPPPGGTAP